MAKNIHYKKIHQDCPFTKEQIDDFRAMLYSVASANGLNAYPSWWIGYNNRQIRKSRENDAYEEWLENELKWLRKEKETNDSRPSG